MSGSKPTPTIRKTYNAETYTPERGWYAQVYVGKHRLTCFSLMEDEIDQIVDVFVDHGFDEIESTDGGYRVKRQGRPLGPRRQRKKR